jgi:O-antigen/teichoic acid export membrane protein
VSLRDQPGEALDAVRSGVPGDNPTKVAGSSAPDSALADRSGAGGTGAERTGGGSTVTDPQPSLGRAALRGAGPIALAGLVANLANIGVTLLVARLLTTRGYGAYAQLIAIFFVLSMPGSALLVGVVRRITAWERGGQESRVAGWAFRTRRRALVLVAAWTVLAFVVRRPLADQLSLPGPAGLAETLAAGAFWGVLCVDRGLLQARHAYRSLAANLLVEGLFRGGLTVLLVGVGFGVGGAATAVLISVVLAELHALLTLRRRTVPGDAAEPVHEPEPNVTGVDRSRERRSLAADVGTALAALALLALLQNLDVVVLGREEPGNAGSYAAISVACKALVLAAFVLAGFLLPEAAARRQLGQHALHQLGVTLTILAVPAVVLLGVGFGAPRTVLSVAFGERLTAAAPAFGLLAAAMTCLAATVLFSHYLLAVGRTVVVPLLVLGTAGTGVLLVQADGDPVSTARADLLGQVVVMVLTGLLVLHAALRSPDKGRSG